MAKITAVLFDCWDTVIHYQETDKFKGIDLLLDVCDNPNNVKSEELKRDFQELMTEYYRQCNAFDLRFTALFRYLCLTHDLTPRITFEEIEKLYNKHIEPYQCDNLDKVISFLKKKRITFGVCSNTIHSKEDTVDFIKQVWPSMPFNFVMASSTYGVKKPNPRFFEVGAKLAHSKKENTMYIGDNFYADVYGSWLADYGKSIWYNSFNKDIARFYRAHPEMPLENIEYTEIHDYNELLPILEELTK